MSKVEPSKPAGNLVLEYELDASPEKVWRAISIPALLERWLPRRDLAGVEPVSTSAGQEICYRMREENPPFLGSIVTFQIRPDGGGGTILRIVHRLQEEREASRTPPAANTNAHLPMRAA